MRLLEEENAALRERVALAEQSTAQTLARATRLSQVVSVLGRGDRRFDAVVASAAREVSELFSADLGVLMLGRPEALSVNGTWGVRDADLPREPFALDGLADLDQRRPVLTGPADALPCPAFLARYRPRHVAWVRLLVEDGSLGVLLLARRADQAFETADEEELRAIGYRIALALENGLLHDQMQRQIVQLGRMHDLTTRLSSELEVGTVGHLLCEAVVTDVGAAGCRVEVLRDGQGAALAVTGEHPDGRTSRAYPLRTADRVVGTLAVTGAPEEDTDGYELLRHVVGVAALALDKALLYERSRDQARLDSLTGLLGHRAFQEEMRRHTGTEDPFTVIRLDIDDFKQVNDLCGHHVGDDALRLVAEALRAGVRDRDHVFRVGGEEFCVIMPGLSADGATALAIAERLRERVAALDLALPITVSLGLAGSPVHARDRDELLELADVALYASKRQGKNRTTLAGAAAVIGEAPDRLSRATPLALLHERDADTVAHSLHVARLAVAVARRLDLPAERLEDLRVAAQLHDVGKIGVPDAILNKPGRLDDEEFRVVKTHPLVGAELLRCWGLDTAARFVVEHHERVDGTGYPAGLAGETIALESRIIHAVDAYVAMTLDRPYRAALPVEEAAAELRRCRGTQFDPAVTDALLAVVAEPAAVAA